MPHSSIEVRPPQTDDEVRRLTEVMFQSFGGFGQPPDRTDSWIAHIGRQNLRVAVRDREVLACLGLFYFDLYFGGQRIPATGVSAVGVAPEVRGDGVGTELMRGILREQARRNIPLSVLYPATYTLYRKVGYEVAGSRIAYKLDLHTLGIQERGLRMRRATPADEPAIEAIYLQRAQRNSGHPHRSPLQWRQLLHYLFAAARIYTYVVERVEAPPPARDRNSRGRTATKDAASTAGAVEGYIIFWQAGQPRGPYELHIRDMSATTPQAARRLLSFLSSHTSMAGDAHYESGPMDFVLSCARDEYVQIAHRVLWMMRMVDAPAALSLRGYSRSIRASLSFELHDDLFRNNNGRFTLRIADGRGALTRLPSRSGASVRSRSRSALRISHRGLAPLFSGLCPAADLRVMGLIEGEDDALRTASEIFAGPAPWMNDRF